MHQIQRLIDQYASACVDAAFEYQLLQGHGGGKKLADLGVNRSATRDALEAAIHDLCADNARLRDFLSSDAECPCCGESVACNGGCSFATDCQDGSDRMKLVRHVLAAAQRLS